MGLGENTFGHWYIMRKFFLKQYQAYCRSRGSKEDIFMMDQWEYVKLEDYLEIFLYNLQKSKHNSLSYDVIHTIFLKGIHDEYNDILNFMGSGDISSLPFELFFELCKKYSRGKAKARKGQRDALSRVTKSAIGSVSQEILDMILGRIQVQRKRVEGMIHAKGRNHIEGRMCAEDRKGEEGHKG
jgi:hypothetical protein